MARQRPPGGRAGDPTGPFSRVRIMIRPDLPPWRPAPGSDRAQKPAVTAATGSPTSPPSVAGQPSLQEQENSREERADRRDAYHE